jgi:hypothetical protein
MKRILLSIALVIASVSLLRSQCTPGPETSPAIYPDTITNIAAAYVGTPYSQVFTIVAPSDTTYMGIPITITSVNITGTSGLPSGFSLACNPSDCKFPGGSKHCAVITGTASPSQIGTYRLYIYVDDFTSLSSTTPTQKDTVKGYVLHIYAAQGVQQNEKIKFSLEQNSPNPADKYCDVIFTTPNAENYQFCITDILGQVKYTETISAKQGENTIHCNTSGLSAGIYFYNISNKQQKISRKMIVSR